MFEFKTNICTAVKSIHDGFIANDAIRNCPDSVTFVFPDGDYPNNYRIYLTTSVTIKCSVSCRDEFMTRLSGVVTHSATKICKWDPTLMFFIEAYKDRFVPEPSESVFDSEKKLLDNMFCMPKSGFVTDTKRRYETKLIMELNETLRHYGNLKEISTEEEMEDYVQNVIEDACKEIFSRLNVTNKDPEVRIPLPMSTRKFGDSKTREVIIEGLKRILCNITTTYFEFDISDKLEDAEREFHTIVIGIRKIEEKK